MFDSYVRIPYADKGRAGQVDCWGLVVKVFAELRGIALRSYADAVAAIVIGYIVATEGAKVWFYKRKALFGRPLQ